MRRSCKPAFLQVSTLNSNTDPDTVFPIINRDPGKFIYDLEKIDFIIMTII